MKFIWEETDIKPTNGGRSFLGSFVRNGKTTATNNIYIISYGYKEHKQVYGLVSMDDGNCTGRYPLTEFVEKLNEGYIPILGPFRVADFKLDG